MHAMVLRVVGTPLVDAIGTGVVEPRVGQRVGMSDISSFPYRLLWEERQLVSVADLTRRDGVAFLASAPQIGNVTKTTAYALARGNDALADLRAGRFEGAAVRVLRSGHAR
jgi:D-arabinose 1-dehydrogenase-like Zn-dependent alcohol dehydrogenase